MNERKTQLIELEQSASEFVEDLKKLTHEIEGYQNAKSKLEETKDALLPLINKVAETLSAVNLIQSDVSKLTSSALLEQISVIKSGIDRYADQLAKTGDDIASSKDNQKAEFLQMQQNIGNIYGLLSTQINETQTIFNEKSIELQRNLTQNNKEMVGALDSIIGKLTNLNNALEKQNEKIVEIINRGKTNQLFNWITCGLIILATVLILIIK